MHPDHLRYALSGGLSVLIGLGFLTAAISRLARGRQLGADTVLRPALVGAFTVLFGAAALALAFGSSLSLSYVLAALATAVGAVGVWVRRTGAGRSERPPENGGEP